MDGELDYSDLTDEEVDEFEWMRDVFNARVAAEKAAGPRPVELIVYRGVFFPFACLPPRLEGTLSRTRTRRST